MYMAMQTMQQSSRLSHCEMLEIADEDLATEHLHAHVVDEDAKRLLLGDRHPLTQSTITTTVEADTLLHNLGRLAQSVAKTVVPKDHARDALVFRLINDVDFVGGEDSYIALSYCWKKVNHDTPRKEISPVGDLPFGWVRTVEQFPLPTSAAMFEAVLREKRGMGEGLWFDQVCINQEDEGEKAMAIGSMDAIYENARAVVVALDDIAADEAETLFLRQYIDQYGACELPLNQQPNRALDPPFMQQHPQLRSFLERVLGSLWFERAWCAHEMRMGRSHVFLVPSTPDVDDETSTLIRFTGAFFLHMLALASELYFSPELQSRIRSLLAFFSHTVALEQHDALSTPSRQANLSQLPLPEPLSLIPLIPEVFAMKAGGDPRLPEYLRRLNANRDKACIALNASGLPLALKQSSPLQRPNIEDECLRQLLLIGLAARDPIALCTTGTPLQLHDGSRSWLCRPTPLDLPNQHALLPSFSNKGTPIAQASDGKAEYVQLDLVFLDLPHRTYPNPLFRNNIQRARACIDIAIQAGIQSSTMWNSWQSPHPEHPRASSMKNVFAQTLACCFECGLHWLLDVSQRIQPATQRLSSQALGTLFSPNLIIQNYIMMDEGRTTISLLLNFLSSLITLGIPWSSGATECSHGPLIVSSSPPSSPSTALPSPVSPPFSSSGKAIILAPFEHSKTLLVAVPDTVKAKEYSGLARGWILTPVGAYTGNTGSAGQLDNWTLQSKGVLYGDRPFNEALSRGQGPRIHRVYGPDTR